MERGNKLSVFCLFVFQFELEVIELDFITDLSEPNLGRHPKTMNLLIDQWTKHQWLFADQN